MTSISIQPVVWAAAVAALVALPAAALAQSSIVAQDKPAAPASAAKPKPAAAPKPAAQKPAAATSATSAQAAKPPAAARPAAPAQAAKPAQGSTAAVKPAPSGTKPAGTQVAAKPTADDEPKLLGQYGEWSAYTATPNGKKLCFALAKPGSSQTTPPNRPRDPAYLFVSTRPGEKVKEEISLIIGYPIKPNTEVVAAIGPTNFALYSQEDGAWIKNASDEDRMVEAMRKGSDLVIKGESGRGTKTTDTFSLKGISQALDRVGQECK